MKPSNAEIKKDTKELVQGAHDNPSNAELSAQIQKQDENFITHSKEDKINFDAIHARLNKFATREDVREIFSQELKTFFKVTGVNTKTFIIGAAVVIGSLVVIFGGIKSVLAWLGFTFIGK